MSLYVRDQAWWMPMPSTFVVIGPSMKEKRPLPAFFRRSASKLRSRSQRSSTRCSSSGRSSFALTGRKRALSLAFAMRPPPTTNTNAVPKRSGRRVAVVPPELAPRAPTHPRRRIDVCSLLTECRSGRVYSRHRAFFRQLGGDGPSDACASSVRGEQRAEKVSGETEGGGWLDIHMCDI